MTRANRRVVAGAVAAAAVLSALIAAHFVAPAGAGPSERGNASGPSAAHPSAASRATSAARPPAPARRLAVYPTADSRTASPRTSISLRGLNAAAIGPVSVRGSQSGPHAGRFRADSDGGGASFYPARPFQPGERVTVVARHQLIGAPADDRDRISFTVSRPAADPVTPYAEYDNPAHETHFVSAPRLTAPVVRVVKGPVDSSSGDLFLAAKHGSGGDGPMIVRPDGTLVWFKPYPPDYKVYDFRVQTYRGHRVLTWWRGFPASGHGRGVDEIYDATYHHIATVRAGNGYAADHHEFQLTAWDTALITSYQPVHWDLRPVGGPADGIVFDGVFQEIDVATGNVLAEWHSLDHVRLQDSYADPEAGKPFDYFHINSLDSLRPGTVLVSSRATHTIYLIRAATGRALWRLGGKHSSFAGNATDLSSQHDAKLLDATHVSVFDNAGGVGHRLHDHSRAVVVHVDVAARTATLVTDDRGRQFPLVGAQGSTQVLPDGHVFVCWTGVGAASEFDASGTEIYRSALPDNDETYREYRFPWRGSPSTAPSVAAARSGATSTVWASWNGATDVAAWRVLVGSTPASVTAVAGTYPRSSFETAMPITARAGYVAVQALGSDGTVLASSRATVVRNG